MTTVKALDEPHPSVSSVPNASKNEKGLQDTDVAASEIPSAEARTESVFTKGSTAGVQDKSTRGSLNSTKHSSAYSDFIPLVLKSEAMQKFKDEIERQARLCDANMKEHKTALNQEDPFHSLDLNLL